MTTTYTCPYCRQVSEGATASCDLCGAPVNVRLRTTAGGWTDLPPIADMTHIQAGGSTVQIQGGISAVADWNLAAGHGVFFPHHSLLWLDPSVTVGSMRTAKPWMRMRAGLPLIMATATGPGHVAFAHSSAGELIALPLQAGASIDVCEHRLLVATEGISFDWQESGVWYTTSGRDAGAQGAGAGLLRAGLGMVGQEPDSDPEDSGVHYPMGRYVDRFTAGPNPGLVMIGARGNAYNRYLEPGESLLIKPPSLLFKDPSVGVQLHVEHPAAGVQFWRSWGNRYLWLRLHGPGRVGIESCYDPHADPGTDFQSLSQATRHAW
jgi:uncharacterized protein (AIM24 family)